MIRIKRDYAIKLLVALALIGLIIFFLYKKKYFNVLEKISVTDFVILTSFTLIGYFTSGFQMYYLVKKQNKIAISLTDTLLLPLSMSLFSYIIPTNGGLLYSVFFLKKKYQIDSTKSFSIGIFSIYISFIITGIFGIVSCIYSKNYNGWILLISLILIFLSLIINVLNRLFYNIRFKKSSLISKSILYLDRIVIHSNNLIMDKEILFFNIIINIVYLGLSLISYQWLNIILEINLPLTSIFIIILITRVSSLIRLLPGNLGLEELYTGGIFKIIGRDPGVGIIFSLILRFTTILVFIPLGILHTVYNMKLLRFGDILNLRKSLTL
jgi:hypothetical protein